MKEDYNGDLYDVYYRDGNGERKCVCYFGYSKRDAERLFNSEKCVGEEIIEIKRCKWLEENKMKNVTIVLPCEPGDIIHISETATRSENHEWYYKKSYISEVSRLWFR